MDLPKNAVTKLRIMTRKSKFGFGKYDDMTVGDIIAIGNGGYIAYAYYNISPISFADDILDELEIIRIDKPGTSSEKWKEYRRMISNRYTEEQRLHYRFRHALIAKAKRKNQAVRVAHDIEKLSTRCRLQMKNHGKL